MILQHYLSRWNLIQAVGLCLSLGCGLVAAHGQESVTDRLLQQAKQTGRPVLAVAGRETCGHCQALKSQLQTDVTLKPFVSQFVAAMLDVDGNEFDAWRNKYGQPGTGLPFMYLVRPDGKLILSHSGPADDVAGMLKQALQASGRPLSARELKQLQEAWQQIQSAQAEQDTMTVIKLLTKHIRTDSFVEPLPDMHALLVELTDAGQKELERIKALVADSKTPSLEEALSVVQALRQYGAIEALATMVKSVEAEVRQQKAWSDLSKQAELLWEVKQAVAAKETRPAQTLTAKLQRLYPDSEAAQQAAAAVQELQTTATSTDKPMPMAKPADSSQTDAAAQNLKKAKTYLSFARQFAAKGDKKFTAQYARQVLELTADNPMGAEMAVEARKLLADSEAE